jgi:hypothetical protein
MAANLPGMCQKEGSNSLTLKRKYVNGPQVLATVLEEVARSAHGTGPMTT